MNIANAVVCSIVNIGHATVVCDIVNIGNAFICSTVHVIHRDSHCGYGKTDFDAVRLPFHVYR